MFCINCGQVNAEDAHFCRFCGTNFPSAQLPPRSSGGNFNTPPPQSNTPQNYKPYSWASDSLQGKISPPSAPPAGLTQPIRQAQPQNQPNRMQNLAQMPNYAPPANYQSPNMLSGYRCPRCGTTAPPQFVKKISTAGWIVFAALLVMFFPLFWIGLLIKEDHRVCPICMMRIG